jgi:catalase (peroxidase I)
LQIHDPQQAFVHDIVAAWDKVMNLDRFDLA